jgi:hypothetical protein
MVRSNYLIYGICVGFVPWKIIIYLPLDYCNSLCYIIEAKILLA